MEHVPRRDAELGAHGNRDREPEDEKAQHEWWEPAPELARAGPRQHARVLRVIVGGRRTHSSPAADSASRYSVACSWRRRNDAGQAVLIGPYSAACTGAALRASGTIARTRRADRSAGIVTVIAWVGTSSTVAKCPSPTCCSRDAASSGTTLTARGSSNSATGGSLNARWPFSPIPQHVRSSGCARSSS